MQPNRPIWTILAILAATHSPSIVAAPLSLAQVPPGTASEPAPNVIVSVDDSGSMGWDIRGCMTMDFNTGVYGNMNEPGSSNCPTRARNPNPSRIADLRTALIDTFGNPTLGTQGILPDGRIRLAWQTMWDNGRTNRPAGQQNNQNTLVAGAVNAIRPFTGAHRTNFHNFLNSLSAVNGTPSHLMMSNVNRYMATTGVNSPFRVVPGQANSPELSCRRTYHVLMTDGAWNSETATGTGSIGNRDGTNTTLPSGINQRTGLAIPGPTYSQNAQTRVYWDRWGGTRGTLADWAFANWVTDFRTDLTNDVRQLWSVQGDETVGATTLQPYWNPRNNPMTWQGVTQHTIGFGNSATTWIGAPLWNNALDSTYAGDYSALVNGTVGWINLFDPALNNTQLEQRRASDLWHAAINGRGKYYPARTGAALRQAFQDILNEIVNQTAAPLVSIAASSSRLRTDGFVYLAGFDSEQWSGSLSAFTIQAGSNSVASLPTWRAHTQLDAFADTALNTRRILTHNESAGTTFVWNNLSPNQQSLLRGPNSDAVGESRVDYLRGTRSLEQQNGGDMRNRASRLGNIVNSNIWYMGNPARMGFDHSGHPAFRTAQFNRTPAIFVGANDGMLHSFNASTGAELFAYVPRGVYTGLRDYTLTNYGHRFSVDGHPFTGDADVSGASNNTPSWRTFLVGGLAAGGRGYFILDVTNPTGVDGASVVVDNTAAGGSPATANAEDAVNDIGHIFSTPVVDPVSGTRSEQIVKLNNNRWAVLMGNGVNSVNERPVLLIQYLDGDRELRTIKASHAPGQTNGLSAPRAIDVDGNGTMDVVYAGDLLGNLWKFDLTSDNATNWGVSNWAGGTTPCYASATTTCRPLYIARTAGGTRQPITVAPVWMAHPQGGVQLAFGTGRNYTEADRADTGTQTFYSVWDRARYSTLNVNNAAGSLIATRVVPMATDPHERNITFAQSRSLLVEQTLGREVGTTGYFETSQNDVDYADEDRGWYFDLPLPRERVILPPQLFEGQKVLFNTTLPKVGSTGETCNFLEGQDDNWINVLNMITGKPSASPVWPALDNTRDLATRTRFGEGEYITVNKSGGGLDLITFTNDSTCPSGELCTDNLELSTSTVPGGRADWRETR